MAINKVVYGSTTLIDLTDSTLSDPSDLMSGVTAYDRTGTLLTGTGTGGGDYILTYDDSSSVGLAEVGDAVTGEPNYTPSGDIHQTMENISFMTGASVGGDLSASFSNGTLTLSLSGLSITPTTATKNVATSAPVFVGNGVHFVITEGGPTSPIVGVGQADYMQI